MWIQSLGISQHEDEEKNASTLLRIEILDKYLKSLPNKISIYFLKLK